MITIGIDFSLTSSGVVVLRDDRIIEFYIIKTNTKLPIEKRTTYILGKLNDTLVKYQGAVVVLEAPAFGAKGSRVYQLFGIHYTVWLLLKRHGKVETIPPTTLKKFATGNGRASKEEMLEALPNDVRKLFIKDHRKTTGLYDLTDAYFLARMLI